MSIVYQTGYLDLDGVFFTVVDFSAVADAVVFEAAFAVEVLAATFETVLAAVFEVVFAATVFAADALVAVVFAVDVFVAEAFAAVFAGTILLGMLYKLLNSFIQKLIK